jgi:hypothetical protein
MDGRSGPAATGNPSLLAIIGESSSRVPPQQPGSKTLILGDCGPEVFFISAEYCLFCAAQRWPLVVCRRVLGSSAGLSLTHSSSTDVHPDTKNVLSPRLDSYKSE